MKPQEVKPKAQTDWLGFCKGGALLSTKWTFVRVVQHFSTPRPSKCGTKEVETVPPCWM